MRSALERLLDSRHTIVFASLVSFALGLFFIFVWSPLPWGWEGIDHYHDQAISLAAGKPFETTDVPWGYAYFLAAFYAIFGVHAWIPLVAQVTLNACVPLLLYRLVAPLGGPRIATLAALLSGLASFNTVYASTQSTDSVSTVLFLTALVFAFEGRRSGRLGSVCDRGRAGWPCRAVPTEPAAVPAVGQPRRTCWSGRASVPSSRMQPSTLARQASCWRRGLSGTTA